MALSLAAALLLAAPPVASAGAQADARQALDAGLAGRAAGAPRAVWGAGKLRGAAYRLSPLGEGAGRDPDPRFRLDRFDCVTFVETALALGGARSVAEAERLLDDVRYAGPPHWERRSHYVEAQWLPSLREKGWIDDATAAVAGERVRQVALHHTAESWRAAARSGRLLPGLAPEALPVGTFSVPVVPLGALPGVEGRVAEGTIVLVVREPRPGRPFVVTHMGIAVVDGSGRRLVRHASTGARRVVDEPFARFAARQARERRWPVAGLSFWAIRDNEARARALLGGR